MNTEGLALKESHQYSERSQTIKDPYPNFKNTNGTLDYRQTFQMCIKSRNDVCFLHWIE